jgi:hypothetical protein
VPVTEEVMTQWEPTLMFPAPTQHPPSPQHHSQEIDYFTKDYRESVIFCWYTTKVLSPGVKMGKQ